MNIFQVVKYVGTPITLVAFIVAAIAWCYSMKLKRDIKLIKTATEDARADLVDKAIESYRITPETDNLTNKQRYDLMMTVVTQRAVRLKIILISTILLTVVFSFTLVTMKLMDKKNGSGTSDKISQELKDKIRELEHQLSQTEILDPHLIYIHDTGPRPLREVSDKYSDRTTIIDDQTASLIKSIESLQEKGLSFSNAETFYRIGLYYHSNGEHKKAINLYDGATSLRPTWYKPLIAKALCLETLDNWDSALEMYRRADELVSDKNTRASVLLNLAATFIVTQRYHQAALTYERVYVLLEPKDALIPRIAADAASAYRLIGNPEKEMFFLKQFISKSSNDDSNQRQELIAAKSRLNEISGLPSLIIDDVIVSKGEGHVQLDVRIRNSGKEVVNLTKANLHVLSRIPYTAAYSPSASYDLLLEGSDNIIPVGHVLKSGEVDSFFLRVGFTKFNTSCGFTAELRLMYNGTYEAISKTITFVSVFDLD